MTGPTVRCTGERGDRLVFIVGSPRSGTTWLQRMMGAHPAVATGQETDLLNRFCQNLYGTWDNQLSDPEEWQRRRHKGLPAVLTEEEFDALVLELTERVYCKVLSLRPGATVVLDKNPEYSLCVPLIRRMYPESAVIHLVRDGRDVASSLLAASRGWGADWAPRQLGRAAQKWRSYVESAMRAAQSGRYLEIRYEDLRADGAHVLRECLEFAGVAAPAEQCAEIVARFELQSARDRIDDPIAWSGEVVRRLGGSPAEPEGFFGTDSNGGGRPAWSRRDLWEFEEAAGDLLRRLGYADEDRRAGRLPAGRVGAAAIARASAALSRWGWKAHMALGRRGIYVYMARVDPYPRQSGDG